MVRKAENPTCFYPIRAWKSKGLKPRKRGMCMCEREPEQGSPGWLLLNTYTKSSQKIFGKFLETL